MKACQVSLLLAGLSSVLAADRWPAKWCDKECIETVLFAKACDEVKEIRNCLCSSHFRTKLNKCQSDGCDENYANKNWNETVVPMLENCEGKFYDGVI